MNRLRVWLAERHSVAAEAATVLALYGAYELTRGFVVGDGAEARRHALQVAAIERWPHLLLEADVQHAARLVPGLEGLLGVAYLTLHLATTVAVLLWLHQRRPDAFPLVRTALLIASGLALLGFLAFPTAPPRLAGIGVADTVSNANIDLNTGLVSSVYNRYAAVPSMHVGYALIVAASVFLYSRRALVRVLASLYPPFVVLVVVATGNHFFFDAAAGVLVAALAMTAAALLSTELDAKHPELLFERTDDLDQDVLRGEVDLAEAVHPRADALGDVREPRDELAHDLVRRKRAALHGRDLARRADCGRLTVGREAQRDGSLCDGVGKLAPRVDELVEMLVQRLEQRAHDAPVQLLAE
jgi:hypothetical protein